ncbi:MAG TPA: hypothetical protein VFN46_09140 [Acetobacteraceae bacterium]|nr:hypothetical protein [Acetobacteraceae bacterium]
MEYPPPLPGHLNIGLLHTAASGRPGHAGYAPCTVEQLAAHGYDYWALGHVHAREILARDPCWIVFPGNTQGRHANEPGPKGATLVTVRDGRVTEVAHHDLDVVRWAQASVDLAGIATEEAALARVRAVVADEAAAARGRLLALRLVLEGACPVHALLLRDPGATRDSLRAEAAACAADGDIWLESVQLRTRPAQDRAALRARNDAIGQLVRILEDAAGEMLAEKAKTYAAGLLNRAAGLRAALGEDHAAVQAAAGTLAPEVLARARDLLLARLAEE